MGGLLALVLFLLLGFYLVGYLFFRSLFWVFEPLIKYFVEREVENRLIEDDEDAGEEFEEEA